MKEIGGYFELELPYQNGDFIHSKCHLVNSGRHALEYILRSLGERVGKVWLPYYTCEVVLQPIERLGIEYEFYHINEQFEIINLPSLKNREFIIANNYFGIKDKYIKELYHSYGDRLIIDNAQAWYAPELPDVNSFYSPRKFVGIPDGGVACVCKDIFLNLNLDKSYERFSHLIKRIDAGATIGYDDFRINSSILNDEPLKSMSLLTKRILSSIDFESAKYIRRSNYEYLAQNLDCTNLLNLPDQISFACPMVYPYYSEDITLRQRLINHKIFVATYWPNVLQKCKPETLEHKLAMNIIPIPIDQRYDQMDMDIILSVINSDI